MRGNHIIMLLLIAIAGAYITSDCAAAIYKYEDKDGMINFADNLQSIPAQYRANAKIVSGEPEEEKKTLAQDPQSTQAEQQVKVIVRGEKPVQGLIVPDDGRPFRRRALTSIIAVMSALFLVALLRVFDAEHAKSVKIARLVLLWGVSIYLVWSHFGDVIHVFTTAGNKVESIQQQAEEKGRKAAKAVKAMDALREQVEKGNLPDQASQSSEEKKEENNRN